MHGFKPSPIQRAQLRAKEHGSEQKSKIPNQLKAKEHNPETAPLVIDYSPPERENV